ncbi:hypothetical protein TELCIR_24616 [Teladorsagia circumcincta]|uniref:Uncharacterized protein n=1 Tax=Teladorsagia circumcincta TaxID=45464 RepID=A0A2G9T7U0_TELCI|nr:hypothetical protein TELCIR_24616 [Teladorsagia circumcincta]
MIRKTRWPKLTIKLTPKQLMIRYQKRPRVTIQRPSLAPPKKRNLQRRLSSCHSFLLPLHLCSSRLRFQSGYINDSRIQP